MLEVKDYTYAEIVQQLNSTDRQGINRKLRNYGIEFQTEGRGTRTVYHIKNIPNPFMLFCITELNVPAQTQFEKMLYYYYYFFNDDTFAGMPNQEQANILMEQLFNVSRQTIANWTRYLERADYIALLDSECRYYAVNKDAHTNKKYYTEISRDLYLHGWHIYWQIRGELPKESSGFAWYEAMKIWGGNACKHRLPIQNAIYNNKIDELLTIINEAVSDELLQDEIPVCLF